MYLNVYTEIYLLIFPSRIHFWIITCTGANLENYMHGCMFAPTTNQALDVNICV